MAGIVLRMVSPFPEYLDESDISALAPRPDTLDGKVLGLFPNWRPSALHMLKALASLLESRYRLKAVVIEPPAMENPQGQKGRLLDVLRDQLDAAALHVRAEGMIASVIDGLTLPPAEIERRLKDVVRREVRPAGLVRSSVPV